MRIGAEANYRDEAGQSATVRQERYDLSRHYYVHGDAALLVVTDPPDPLADVARRFVTTRLLSQHAHQAQLTYE